MDYGAAAFLAVMGIFSFVLLLIGAVFYILKSIGLSTLASNRGIQDPWLAWIPVADLYIAGQLVGELDIGSYRLENLALWFPVIVVGGIFLSGMPGIGWLISIGVSVFFIWFTFKFFEIYTDQAILYTVLSVLLCLLPVFIFIIRNNPPLTKPGVGPSA